MRQLDSRSLKPRLPRELFNQQGVAGLLFRTMGRRLLGSFELLKAFHKHIDADKSKHDHVSDLNEKVRIAHMSQDFDELHSDRPAQYAADEQQDAHLEIHIPQAIVGQGAGGGCPHDLVGIGSGCHRRWNADHNQDRRHQESPSHSEYSGEQPDKSTHDKDQKDIYAVASNR